MKKPSLLDPIKKWWAWEYSLRPLPDMRKECDDYYKWLATPKGKRNPTDIPDVLKLKGEGIGSGGSHWSIRTKIIKKWKKIIPLVLLYTTMSIEKSLVGKYLKRQSRAIKVKIERNLGEEYLKEKVGKAQKKTSLTKQEKRFGRFSQKGYLKNVIIKKMKLTDANYRQLKSRIRRKFLSQNT